MLKSIWNRLFKKPVKVHAIFPDGYTLEEWRANKSLPEMLRKILEEPTMRHAFSVLYNRVPSGFPIRGDQVSDIQAAVELGRVNGYMECLSLLKSLAITPHINTEVEQTYGAEHTDDWN